MKYNKLFIVGSGRSGTTWTLRIFCGHPSVVSPGTESKVYQVIGPYLRWKNINYFWRGIIKYYDSYEKGTRMHKIISRKELIKFIDKERRKK